MEVHSNMTVVTLKAAAKAYGFKGYSKLRKNELLQLFNNDCVYRASGVSGTDIMDTPVPDIKVPTLIPSVYVPKSFVKKIYDKTRSANNTFADWITSYIPPKKIVNEKLEALKKKSKDNIQ